jgi:hypothetical protein
MSRRLRRPPDSPALWLAGLLLLAGPALAQGAQGAESRIRFREAAADWGLDFRHHHGGSGKRYMAETVVGGVVIFDYDGDGDPDVFFVDGGALPGYEGEAPRSRLFRNDAGSPSDPEGQARFVDVTDRSGIDVAHYGSGAVAGDVDGDGDLDLYVTELGADQLFENLGDGSFRDATAEAGLGAAHWTTSATLFDADRDGDLDLYAVGYVDFQVATHHPCRDPSPGGEAGEAIESYCHPEAYEGLQDLFYRNEGDGTFTDATEAAGFAGLAGSTGPGLAGLGVVAGDLDGDGYPEVYVANDADPNLLFANRGPGEDGPSRGVRFEDVSLVSGTAYGQGGKAEGGMGVEMTDADGDGRPDLFVTNFEIETNAFYRNLGAGLFNDARFASGIASGSLTSLAFGTVFGDFDHDGDPDVAIANGHILDNAPAINPRSTYAQRNQVYENLTPPGAVPRFVERTDTGLDEVRVSRGLAHGDLDLDGDLDLVVVNSNDRADAYENVSEAAGGWLTVAVRGGEGNGRGESHGIGTRLELDTGEGDTARRQVKEVRTASSYLSQNDLPVHFGLPAGAGPARLTVRWPDGTVQRYEGLAPGTRLRVKR